MHQEGLPQLRMRRPHLDNLPPIDLPDGYLLRRCDQTYTDAERSGLAQVLQSAFPEIVWSETRVEAALVADPTVRTTFYIQYGDTIVATATVRIDAAFPGSGYLHWVASDPTHRGKRLGLLVSLAVLYEFAALGLKDAVLNTDDPRIPAIKTYLALDFVPESSHPSHEARWAAIQEQLAK